MRAWFAGPSASRCPRGPCLGQRLCPATRIVYPRAVKKLALILGLLATAFQPGAALAADDADVDDESAADDADDEAAADDADDDDADEKVKVNPEDAKSPDDRDFGHGGQFGLRVGATWGYRMVFRYPDSPFCSKPDTTKDVEDQQQFCGHNGPWALDAGLSYGVLDSIEPYLWGRFGLQGEPQTNTEAVLLIGAGARIYTMSDSAFKIFVEPALAFELEGGAGNPDYDPAKPGGWEPADRNDYHPEYKRDLVFHVAAGPHWDFAEQFGAFVSAGLSVGVLRYIHAAMEVQLGVQLRLP